jgi:hypothetical protein
VIGWLILAAYVSGFLYTTRRFTLAQLEQEAQHALSRTYRDDKEPLLDGEDRALALTMGAMLGLIWPLALPMSLISRGLKPPAEVAEEQRRELEQLRALAQKHGLPMPSQQDTTDTETSPGVD